MSQETVAAESSSPPPPPHTAWPHIKKAIEDLRFGEVTLIVQDGVIVQVNRLEKTRLHCASA